MLHNMWQPDASSLRGYLRGAANLSDRVLSGVEAQVPFTQIVNGTGTEGRLDRLRGKSILLRTRSQLPTAAALLELDGVARRLILCPPDVGVDYLPSVIESAEIDVILTDGDAGVAAGIPVVRYGLPIRPVDDREEAVYPTEWVLMTSATTGAPKLVVHDRSSLTAAIRPAQSNEPVVWATFYDIRRYGGLQIFLRSVLSAGSMVLSDAGESTSAHLRRLGMAGVTHISGTPTHWRRALMSGAAHLIAPKYIRLSGEIADQAILDQLRDFYPNASIGHAYASTEAGVAFDVNDGLEGFPASLLQNAEDVVEMRLEQGSLRVRSLRMAARYLGTEEKLVADDGFVDTGDMLERRGDRYYFMGRRSGIINVGGLKVHPEEVESVINLHSGVRMSLVKARRSPITGALVVADVVLEDGLLASDDKHQIDVLRDEILYICRDALLPHKVPAAIRFVPSLPVAASGKLARSYA